MEAQNLLQKLIICYQVFSGLAVDQRSEPNFANHRRQRFAECTETLALPVTRVVFQGQMCYIERKTKVRKAYLPIRTNTFKFWNAIFFKLYISLQRYQLCICLWQENYKELKFLEESAGRKGQTHQKLPSSPKLPRPNIL